jgi:hypothetical protein
MGDHCRPNQRMRYGPSSSWERHDDRGDPSSDRLLSPFIFYRGSKRTSSRNSMVLILLAHPTGDARNPSKLLNQKGFSPTRFGPVYQSLVVHGSGAGTMEPLRNCSAKSVSDPNRTPQADPLDDRFAPMSAVGSASPPPESRHRLRLSRPTPEAAFTFQRLCSSSAILVGRPANCRSARACL